MGDAFFKLSLAIIGITIGGLIVFMLAGRAHRPSIAQVNPPTIASAHKDTGPLIRSAKAITANLIDPESARVKDVEVFWNGDSVTICGSVNAKNTFGGYVGFRAFIYREIYEEPYQVKIAEDDNENSYGGRYIKSECLKDKREAK